VTRKTGLLLDPYFSGTKVAWILDNVPGARARAERGELAFGTVDSFLLWRLTGGAVHATDATNASRTVLFNIHEGDWDDELLALLDVPRSLLPEVRDCSGDFGTTLPDLFGAAIPIRGVAGDQQAATVGQACFRPGMLKSTYGTGCFALLNTGHTPVASTNKLLTTIAYQLEGQRTYALEGSIFVAGAAVQWLRDGLGIVDSAAETGPLADGADPAQDVTLVPAFVGLGAPYWNPDVRGALFGLTRNTGPRELARAALESVCFQTADLLAAMRADWRADGAETVLRVDGGMVTSDWTMQRLADLLAAPVDRPEVKETTALGAAYLAGPRQRRLPGAGPLRRPLAARAPLRAHHGRGYPPAEARRLAERRPPAIVARMIPVFDGHNDVLLHLYRSGRPDAERAFLEAGPAGTSTSPRRGPAGSRAACSRSSCPPTRQEATARMSKR
jgi:glycerol kinase